MTSLIDGKGAVQRFDALPAGAQRIWAKSALVEGEPGHGLLGHLLDVAAVAERVLALESPQTLAWAASAFGLEPATAARWLATMVGLHDLGKAIPGFQAKWPAGRDADSAAGLSFQPAELTQDQHDLASAFELRRLLAPWAGSSQRAAAVAAAVAAHHGHVFDSPTIHGARRPGEGAAWGVARQAIFHAYMATLAPPVATGDADVALPALSWLAGLTSLCDWVGSNSASARLRTAHCAGWPRTHHHGRHGLVRRAADHHRCRSLATGLGSRHRAGQGLGAGHVVAGTRAPV